MDEYIECKVSNWPKFMVFSQHLNTQKWLFRGQADSDWTLKTSHERLLDQLVDKYKFIISKVCEENRELIKLQRFSLESKIDKIKSQTLDINKIKNFNW